MKVVRIESVVYGAEDVAEATRYFEDWGLAPVERGASGADFTMPSGQMVQVRRADDPTLPAPIQPGSTAREIIWGVEDDRSIDGIAAEMSRDRAVTRGADGVLRTRDPNTYPIGFRVTRGDAPFRAAGAPSPGSVQPRRIAHVVYNIPKSSTREAADFYIERLNFLLTDRVLDTGEFVRAPGARDHHNLFLLHKPNRIGFNHAAFELASQDDVMRAGAHMQARGWKTAIEPGQHFLSGQNFWYFHCPCGGHAEYFTATLFLDDSWTPRIVETTPG